MVLNVATQDPLYVFAYAPALVTDDGRLRAMVHGFERALPGLSLDWTVSDERQIVSLPRDRDAWLAQSIRDGGFPLVHNNDKGNPVMISGTALPAPLGPGGHALLDAHAKLPSNAAGIAAGPEVLEAVAEGARAFWGHATPSDACLDIARQTLNPFRQVPPRGLPGLKHPQELRAPEIPHRLGWLNYWSAAAVQVIGFPDPTRDADLLSRSRRTATGGWVVRLTDEPLDLDNPAHLATLLQAYERFPVIGGRSAG